MATSQEKLIPVLNELIEICKDGQKGFASAADVVEDAKLRSLFRQYSQQRAQFAAELQKEVLALGDSPETGGSAAGAVHRGWIGLKAALTGKDDHAIVVECERGEDAAKAVYEKAIDGSALPGTVLPMVKRQYAQIREAHNQVRDIRDTMPVGTKR